MPAESCLTLQNYIVKTMNFSINEDFEFNQKTAINISPKFRRTINKIDENSAIVCLGFSISNEKNDMPFSIEINIEGHFHLKNWEQPEQITIMTSNTIAILFPYLRSIVSTLTSNANIPPYILPIMNIASLFDEE